MKKKTLSTLFVVTMLVATITNAESCKKDAQNTDLQITVTEDTPVTDYDGNTYKTIKIGNQIWMAENLKSIHYSNGTPIQFLNPNNSEENVNAYGRLYKWSAIMNGSSWSNSNPSNVQGIAPAGWHLPSITEWTELIDYLGGIDRAAGYLKEAGTTHWFSPNTGNNESMFTALPSGIFDFSDSYQWFGNHCVFASATTYTAVMLQNTTSKVVVGNSNPADGISVRCLKNQ